MTQHDEELKLALEERGFDRDEVRIIFEAIELTRHPISEEATPMKEIKEVCDHEWKGIKHTIFRCLTCGKVSPPPENQISVVLPKKTIETYDDRTLNYDPHDQDIYTEGYNQAISEIKFLNPTVKFEERE